MLPSDRRERRIRQLGSATRVASVADREGDIFELLAAGGQGENADILVRAYILARLGEGLRGIC